MGGKKTRRARDRENEPKPPERMREAATFIARSNHWQIQAYSRHRGQWWVTYLNPKASSETAQFSASESAVIQTFEDWQKTDEGKEWASGQLGED